MSTYNRIDSKLIFRIDFKPTLKYFDQIFRAASLLEGEFEHWKASHNPAVGVLFDAKSQRTINISGQSLSFTTKNIELIQDPFSEISRFIVLLLSESDIVEIGRIGVRRLSLDSTGKSYDDYVEKFFKEFYGSQKQLRDIAADKLDDVVLVLQGIKESFHNRNQAGPIKESQIDQLYGYEEYETVGDIELGGKTGVLIDTDVYSLKKVDLDDALKDIEAIIKVSYDIHRDMKRCVEDKI